MASRETVLLLDKWRIDKLTDNGQLSHRFEVLSNEDGELEPPSANQFLTMQEAVKRVRELEADENAPAQKLLYAPAMALTVIYVLSFCILAIDLTIHLFIWCGGAGFEPEPEAFVGYRVAGDFLLCVADCVSIVAASRMFALKNYSFAKFGAFAMVAPWYAPALFLEVPFELWALHIVGIPFGLWAMLALSDPKVSGQFK